MSDIANALTPEEWDNRMLPGVVCANVRYDIRHGQWFHELSIFHSDDTKDSLHAVLSPEQAHGVAALMLHEQPFGFTHEDVQTIRDIARAVSFGKLGDVKMTRANALNALAERIAALLPPEKG